MKPEETIDFNIRWAWHRISKAYSGEAARHDITMSIGYILLNIDKEGTPSTKLGPKMGMEPTSLSRTLKSMETDGLIYRVPDPTDWRVVRIHLTDEGNEKRKVARTAVIRFNESISEQMPKAKLRNFFEVLDRLNTILEQQDVFATDETND